MIWELRVFWNKNKDSAGREYKLLLKMDEHLIFNASYKFKFFGYYENECRFIFNLS